MFDIGFWELAIILIVGLIVIGPDKLPGVARTLGTWVKRTRRFVSQVKMDIETEIRTEELKKAISEDAGLDKFKEIMQTQRFTLEEDTDKPVDIMVKAIDDDKPVAAPPDETGETTEINNSSETAADNSQPSAPPDKT